jgi:hypothetical protein
MSLARNLQKASFRGAQFAVFDAEVLFGRRNVLHEYPLKDEPFAEDLGRKAREYTINAFVIGEDYQSARNALMKAIEDDETPGTLVHPTLGSILVIPKECRVRFNNKEGNIEYFTLTFIEAGSQSFPSGGSNTGFFSSLFSSNGISSLINFFSSSFRVLNLPDFLHASAVNNITGNPLNVSMGNTGSFTSLVRNVLSSGNFGSANEEHTEIGDMLTKLDNNVDTYVDEPETLGNKITTIIVQLSNVFLNQPVLINSENTYLSTIKPNHPELSALEAQKRLQAYGDGFAEVPLTTDLRLQQAANQEQLINLIRHCSLCEMIRITSIMDYASRQDALETRDVVDSYISPRLIILADDKEDEPYLALNKARAAMVKDVNTRAATLKNKKYVQTADAVPAIVFAYDQYEDASQDAEIIRRNKIRNPVFIPPLTLVEVLV